MPPESAEIPLTHIPVQKDISLQFFQENRFTTFREIQNLVRGSCVPTLSDIYGLKVLLLSVTIRLGPRPWGPPVLRLQTRRGLVAQAPTMGTTCASSSNQAWAPQPPVQQNTVLSRRQNQEMFLYEVPQSYGGRPWNPKMSPEERELNETTMFMMFSKGYPVSEDEIRLFFVNYLGDCIESFYMQEVRGGEHALYARIVFCSASLVNSILRG